MAAHAPESQVDYHTIAGRVAHYRHLLAISSTQRITEQLDVLRSLADSSEPGSESYQCIDACLDELLARRNGEKLEPAKQAGIRG